MEGWLKLNMVNFTLSRGSTGLLLIDVQQKLFPHLENGCAVLHKLIQITEGFRIMSLPIYVSEQYPEGLGKTLPPLRECLGPEQEYLSKTSFSCMRDDRIKNEILSSPVETWVLAGIEAHICVLQTAKHLLKEKKQVVALNDAISSRSIYDYSSAVAELRDAGARISTAETVLFELLESKNAKEFKEISRLVQREAENLCSCCQQ